MHPDFCLVLQKCASNLSLKPKTPTLSPILQTKTMSCSTNETSHSSKEEEDANDLVRIVSDDDDDGDGDEDLGAQEKHPNATAHKISSKLSNAMDQEDNISICSELSVGQEHTGGGGDGTQRPDAEDEEILDISDTHSMSSTEERNNTPSTPGEPSSLNPFALANTLRFPVPFALQAAPVTSLAPTSNMSPFQEEFLRKSHLYAEELMKHQMHLMAAARASAFSLRSQSLHNAATHLTGPGPSLVHINPLTKIGQISAAAAAAALTAAAAQQHSKPLNSHHHHHPHHPQAQHIIPPPSHPHSHHHIPSSPSDTLAKLTALSKQTSSSSTTQMMSTLNQLQTQMQAHLPGLLHDNNDNLHERALKFSIDNILKADFGRGQSPPLTKKAHHFHRTQQQRPSKSASSSASSTTSNNTTLCDTLDQTAQQTAAGFSAATSSLTLGHSGNSSSIPASAQTFSSSLASICTNSNDSNSTAVSSNYSSANGTGDLIKSSPSQTPTLSPGLTESGSIGKFGSAAGKSSADEGGISTTTSTSSGTGTSGGNGGPIVWPAWVYCTRYSDRPSSGEFFFKCSYKKITFLIKI